MQMVFCYYLVAWNKDLPKAAPLLWGCDLIFAADRRNVSLPLIHLAGGEFWLRQAGRPSDPWVKSLTVLGRQPVWASDGARMTEAIGLWLADLAAGFCKLSRSGVRVGTGAAKMGMNVLILLPLWEQHTQAIFTDGGTHCWRRQSVSDVHKLLKVGDERKMQVESNICKKKKKRLTVQSVLCFEA